jgi:hypothetical protein
MTTITLPTGTVVVFHDSARKLPESRRVEADCYSLIESGIGSSIEDIDRHYEPMLALIAAGNYDDLPTAINNQRYLFYNLLHKQISARSLALMCLIHTVDSKEWDDYTEEGLTKLVEQLSANGLTDELISETLTNVKKNSSLN